jgi:hypothetical protein
MTSGVDRSRAWAVAIHPKRLVDLGGELSIEIGTGRLLLPPAARGSGGETRPLYTLRSRM